MDKNRIFFISTDYDMEVVNNNLKRSEIVNGSNIILARDCKNVSKSYNLATGIMGMSISFMMADAIAYVHNDVFMPKGFQDQLNKALDQLHETNWGVLGLAGARIDHGLKRTFHGNINDRGKEWGKPISEPVPVQTLDELMIIVNPEADLMFDEQFDLDFYGADICMQAHERGLGVFAIQAYVHHNSTRPFGGRTQSFFDNQQRFMDKWKHRLPIATTCATLTHNLNDI